MNSSNTTQLDFNRILRTVRQEFRVVELKELLNEFGYGGSRVLSKAQLQSRVEELLNSDKRNQVANSIYLISRRLNGFNRISTDMRTGTSSSNYTAPRYTQNPTVHTTRQPAFGTPPFNNAYLNAANVRYLPLPFYDIKETLLAQVFLTPNQRNEPNAMSSHYTFIVPRQYLSQLSYRETDAIPRYEVQMRMALCELDKEQPDAFPNNVKVTVNGALVNLPPLLNVQPQPGQPRSDQQKRVSRPVNLTPYCNPNREQPYKLTVDWQPDRHAFVIGIWIVYHVNSTILRDRLKSQGLTYYEETKALICKNLGGTSEDDISMDSLKISLVCPLSRVRMSLPVKSTNCTHLQCFDLHNYLMMNEKRPNWKCPVCNKPCPYNLLVIDKYFAEIIDKATGNEVELLPNGGWRPVHEKANKKPSVNTTVGTSAPPSILKAESSNADTTSAPSSAKPPPSAPDLITLDDSDEEEKNEPPSSVASSSTKQSETRKRVHEQISSNKQQDLGIITLGDSSDEEDTMPLQPNSTVMYPIETKNPSTDNIFEKNKHLFDSKRNDDIFSKMDAASVTEISMALLNFMQNLEDDNKNCA